MTTAREELLAWIELEARKFCGCAEGYCFKREDAKEAMIAAMDKFGEMAEKEISGLMETLADIEHERWSKWHEYSEQERNEIRVSRWNELAQMRYSELPDFSKDSDRKEVRRTLKPIFETIYALRASLRPPEENNGDANQRKNGGKNEQSGC